MERGRGRSGAEMQGHSWKNLQDMLVDVDPAGEGGDRRGMRLGRRGKAEEH